MTDISGFVSYALSVSVTWILACEGMSLAGNSGVFVIFNEGVMLAGASTTFLVAYSTGNVVLGLIAGAATGLVFGVLESIFTITLRQDQFIVGIGLYIFASGVASMLFDILIGHTFKPPTVPTLAGVEIPFLTSLPYVGPILFGQNVFFYFALLATAAIWFFLYKTRPGLVVRSVGESPRTADSLGINVILVRYAMTTIGGIMIALGGAYIMLAFAGTYTISLISGRGWISILIALFGRFRPAWVLVGALFFAAVQTGALFLQIGGFGAPIQVILMIPFIVALLLMIQAYRHAELPKGLGKAYNRESLED